MDVVLVRVQRLLYTESPHFLRLLLACYRLLSIMSTQGTRESSEVELDLGMEQQSGDLHLKTAGAVVILGWSV